MYAINADTSVDARQLDILIKIDFFSDFGNQRELFAINDYFNYFKCGSAKQVKKENVVGTQIEDIVAKYSVGTTKSGAESKSFIIQDCYAILRGIEELVKSKGLEDLSIVTRAKNYNDIMGYAGYITGNEADRRYLYIREVFPVKRKKDGKIFAYNILTSSLGSGIESSMTVFKGRFEEEPIIKGEVIVCLGWKRDGEYYRMTDYKHAIF